MNKVFTEIPQEWGRIFMFLCPGCDRNHGFHCRDDGRHPSWSFDGDREKPTFSPSLLVTGVLEITDAEHATIMSGGHVEPVPFVCHSFVRSGSIEFLTDCTHHLAGKTVVLVPES